MIVESARVAMARLFSPPFRVVLYKSLGMTILLLMGAWFAFKEMFASFVMPWINALVPNLPDWAGWLGFVFAIISGIGLALLLAMLIAPITSIIAGNFVDDAAAIIEREDYPRDEPGVALAVMPALWESLKFLGVVIVGNIVALMLFFVPGVNLIAFFVINGYLLGRQNFEFAAMRLRPRAEAKLFRKKHASTVFLGGLIIAGFLAIPFLNLVTPLFAAAMMVHLHKMISQKDSNFDAVEGFRRTTLSDKKSFGR